MSDTLEGYNKLKENGTFDAVDKKVFEVINRNKSIDAQEAHVILSDRRISYNLVQQAFTRLKNAGKIFKVGTHKGASGFTRGLYSVDKPEEERDLFG
jgi:hypothetical protein